jgi:hypothetical protein
LKFPLLKGPKSMPQIQLALFPQGVTHITPALDVVGLLCALPALPTVGLLEGVERYLQLPRGNCQAVSL